MPENELESIILKYGRLDTTSDGVNLIYTLYMNNGMMIFSMGKDSYYGALIEIYDDLRHYMMVETGSESNFE